VSVLWTLKKLLLGETWLLPVGLAVAVAATLLVRDVLGSHWHQLGGFALLAAVIALSVTSVARSAGAR
jgi:hypothetical protein